MQIAGEVQQYVLAAVGWLQLGNWHEAGTELELVPENLRRTEQIYLLRCLVSAYAGRWKDLERLAQEASAAHPRYPCFYNHWAWALHQQGRTTEGVAVAASAAEEFPENDSLAYGLACLYAAQKRISQARYWLSMAMERAQDVEQVKQRALHQPELAVVWDDAH